MDLFLFLGGAFTNGEALPEPEPAVVSELRDISSAFAADMSPIHLLPHEWRQLQRIKEIAKRDRKRALAALRIFSKRATAARRAMRAGARA